MADKEISSLTAATTPLAGTEEIHIDQGGNSRRVAVSEIAGLVNGAMLKSTYDPNDDGIIAVAQGGTNASTASGARTNLGLGTMAVQAASSVNITGGTVTGITDLAIADGGTGASSASAARENLGLEIGVDVQEFLGTGTNGQVLTWTGGVPTWGSVAGTGDMLGANNLSEIVSPSTARTNLELGTAAVEDVEAFAAPDDLPRLLVEVADEAEIATAIAGLTGPLLVRLAKKGTYSQTAQIDLPDGSLLDLNGSTVTVSASIQHSVAFAVNATDVGVINGKIVIGRQTDTSPNHGWLYSVAANGSGLNANSEAAVIFGEGTQNFIVRDIEISGVNARAVSFRASATRPVKNGLIKGVYAHSPQDNGGTAYGPGNFIFVRPGPQGYANGPENVIVEDCELWGIDPSTFDPTDPAANIDVYSATNERSGDLCVIQNGLNCKFVRVKAYYSGEVGMDFTIGSRNCDVIDCTAKYNNRDGVFIGGGYSWVQMSQADAQSFTAGNACTGGTSATTADVFAAGVEDLAGNWWVLFTNTTGNAFWQVGETITEDGAPTGSGAVLAIRYAAEYCRVVGGTFNDNVHDEGGVIAGAGGNVKVQRGYYCDVIGADIGHYENVAHDSAVCLYVASSPKILRKGNRVAGRKAVTTAGASSSIRASDVQELRLNDFGAVVGDGSANRSALAKAISICSANAGGRIIVPDGTWTITGTDDFAITSDETFIVGEGPNSILEFGDCSLRFDAVTKTTHQYRCGLRDVQLRGASGVSSTKPILELRGQNTMGQSRFTMANVHVFGRLDDTTPGSRTRVGVLARGCWSSSWTGGAVSTCSVGFSADLAPDSNTSANAWKITGVEIQGNDIGVYADKCAGLNLSGSYIEGNNDFGIMLANNARAVTVKGCYFESNGFGYADPDLVEDDGYRGRDIQIGDPDYSGTKVTGHTVNIGDCWFGAGVATGAAQAAAIGLNRASHVVISGANTVIGYAEGFMKVEPQDSNMNFVTNIEFIRDPNLASGTPEIVVDSAGAALWHTNIKRPVRTWMKRSDVAIDIPSVAAGGSQTSTVTVSGIDTTWHVFGFETAAALSLLHMRFRVSAADTVTWTALNNSGSAIDPGNATFRLLLVRDSAI